jgi:hypothetical protein
MEMSALGSALLEEYVPLEQFESLREGLALSFSAHFQFE